MASDSDWMKHVVELAVKNVDQGGKPFGAVLVRDGIVLGEGVNEVLASGDPTTHAEMQAIRAASRSSGPDLTGAVAYASGHPCPMCLAALYVAGVREIFFGSSLEEATAAGLGVDEIYRQVSLPNEQRAVPLKQLSPGTGGPGPLQRWLDRTSME